MLSLYSVTSDRMRDAMIDLLTVGCDLTLRPLSQAEHMSEAVYRGDKVQAYTTDESKLSHDSIWHGTLGPEIEEPDPYAHREEGQKDSIPALCFLIPRVTIELSDQYFPRETLSAEDTRVTIRFPQLVKPEDVESDDGWGDLEVFGTMSDGTGSYGQTILDLRLHEQPYLLVNGKKFPPHVPMGDHDALRVSVELRVFPVEGVVGPEDPDRSPWYGTNTHSTASEGSSVSDLDEEMDHLSMADD